MTTRKVVLDASAVLAWVLNERGAGTVDRLLPVAVTPASGLVEVLYRAVERGHRLSSQELYGSLLGMGLNVESVLADDVVRAAELIATSRRVVNSAESRSLSLGDGLCCAVAERLELPVSGGDTYWEKVPMSVSYLPFR